MKNAKSAIDFISNCSWWVKNSHWLDYHRWLPFNRLFADNKEKQFNDLFVYIVCVHIDSTDDCWTSQRIDFLSMKNIFAMKNRWTHLRNENQLKKKQKKNILIVKKSVLYRKSDCLRIRFQIAVEHSLVPPRGVAIDVWIIQSAWNQSYHSNLPFDYVLPKRVSSLEFL